MRIIGEAQSQWAPLRRKYNLFLYHQTPNTKTDLGTQRFNIQQSDLSKAQQMQLTKAAGGDSAAGEFHQFAYVDEPFLSWDFSLLTADNRLIGSVNRNFAGFARELFTDTGVYALRMDSAALAEAERTGQAPMAYTDKVAGMTLDQRAVMLATAVSIDFDYFSRHSSPGGVGVFPIWIPGGGEAAAGGAAGEAGAAGAGAAGAAGETAVGEAAAGTVGRAGAAGAIAEGAAAGAAGAGAMAGYEAMQRGMAGRSQPPPPEQQQQQDQWQAPTPGQPDVDEEVWGEVWEEDEEDPWGRGGGGSPWGGGGSAAGGSQGGGGGEDNDFDWF